MSVQLHLGNSLDVMRGMEVESVTAVVTDPPYGLGFMGKAFDTFPSPHEFQAWTEEWAREAIRVAKPGAVLLCFAGTRTFHRVASGIEDAGWEIRDCLLWIYGSGFPKGIDVGKAIDKDAGIWRGRAGAVKSKNVAMSAPNDERTPKGAPVTDAARLWSGYWTSLKPAWEPIIVAMKPPSGTFVKNAANYGVAGLNIDGCRVSLGVAGDDSSGGRYPSNVVLDEEASTMLYKQSGHSKGVRCFYCAKASKREREAGLEELPVQNAGAMKGRHDGSFDGSVVRARNTHPTVKPFALMRWLVRLVTMPSGTLVLDPFMGSGTTGIACVAEGVGFVGIEVAPEYYEIARRRIAAEKEGKL